MTRSACAADQGPARPPRRASSQGKVKGNYSRFSTGPAPPSHRGLAGDGEARCPGLLIIRSIGLRFWTGNWSRTIKRHGWTAPQCCCGTGSHAASMAGVGMKVVWLADLFDERRTRAMVKAVDASAMISGVIKFAREPGRFLASQ